jgi:zinc/manganese transport system permease protein
MTELLTFLAAPIAMAVLLVGLHAYLGLHVLEREVVFVDIGLAQISALGTLLCQIFFHEYNKPISLISSFALCLLVSFFLAYHRKAQKSISQEVLVAMVYALASGLTILITDRIPHGVEHLKHTLVGNILFVSWESVLVTLVIYSLVGSIHWLYREQFWKATRGESSGILWDFFFYALFSLVITISTMHAGVLVVFAILMAPAALARSLFQKINQQMMAAWIFGILGIFISFGLSSIYDLPAGASITSILSAVFLGSLLFRRKIKNQ